MRDRGSFTVSFCAVILALWLMASMFSIAVLAQSVATVPDAFAYSRLLGHGINLGNALEAPSEGKWGVTLKPEYFQVIKDAGFNSVRIPINWAAHAQLVPPYTIDPGFFARIDWAIDQALSRDLLAVIDLHHFTAMDEDPSNNKPELLALWTQIAERYRDRSQKLLFELFNEPQAEFTDPLWNEALSELLQVVRHSNPTRMVIVGPANWNSGDHLSMLRLPDTERRLIVTFHYYKPMHFTHQAQSWAPESMAWKGTSWGSTQEYAELHQNFRNVADWASHQQRPIYLGEFGSSERAAETMRVLWTRAVVSEARRYDFSWAYWQFSSNFGIYDTTARAWNQPILDALLNAR